MQVEAQPGRTETPVKHTRIGNFYLGGGGTLKGGGSIKSELAKIRYGENASIVGSSFGAGNLESNHFRSLSETLATQVKAGEQVQNIVHSWGADDLAQVEKGAEEILGDQKNLLAQNTHDILISPAIPKNPWRALRYGINSAKMFFQEFSSLRFQFPGLSKGRRSINSLISVLPLDFAEKKETYIKGVRRAYRRLSQIVKNKVPAEIIPFEPETGRNYLADTTIFSREEQEKITAIDKTAREAMEKGKWHKVRSVLHKRAQRIRKTVNKMYRGDYVATVGDKSLLNPQIPKTTESKRQKRNILYHMFLRGKAYKHFEERAKAGADLPIIGTEFEILTLHKEMRALQKIGKNVKFKIMEFTTHAAPWAVKPGIMRRILSQAA